MSHELICADPRRLGALPFGQNLIRRPGVARSRRARRVTAVVSRNLCRPPGRRAARFYSGVARTFPSQVTTLQGLEFSLRPPRWARKLKVGRILGKTLKIGALVAGAAILAPAAAGLATRAGFSLLRGGRLLSLVGSKAFRLAAGRRSMGGIAALKRAALKRAHGHDGMVPEPTVPTPPSVTAPVAASMPTTEAERSAVAMTATGPMIPDDSAPDEAETAAAAPTKPGINPALVIGGLVIGGLLLMPKRKGRAA